MRCLYYTSIFYSDMMLLLNDYLAFLKGGHVKFEYVEIKGHHKNKKISFWA